MAYTERYVSALASGGAAGTEGDPWNIEDAFNNAVAGDRLNMKNDGDYLNNESFPAPLQYVPANPGTVDDPIEVRGYNTTIGDATDACATITAGQLNFHALQTAQPNWIWKYMIFTGNSIRNKHGINTDVAAYNNIFYRCKVNNVGRRGANLAGYGSKLIECEMSFWAMKTAAQMAVYTNGYNIDVLGCYFHDATNGRGPWHHTIGGAFAGNIVANVGHEGLFVYGAAEYRNGLCYNNTIHKTGTNGIRITGATIHPYVIQNTLLSEIGSIAISGDATTNPIVVTDGIALHDITGADTANIVETALKDHIQLTASPFVDADNDDFRLNNLPGAGALCRGIERKFHGLEVASYEDIGAMQSRERQVVAFSDCGL